MSTVRIHRRFRGPPNSGNGGYIAGLVASALGGTTATVTLKAPPPLDSDLTLTAEDAFATLTDADQVIVTASSEPVEIDVPPPPSLDAAKEAEPRYVGHAYHNFPHCFVCGPDRDSGDGMRIFPGSLGDPDEQVAATWTPDDSLAGEDGMVRPEFLWAALDCPGYFAAEDKAGRALLGRMSASLKRRVAVGEHLVITGWPISSEGRKHRVGSAVHDSKGELVAAATATWITVGEDLAT